MADLSLTHHPVPAVIADPGRQTITVAEAGVAT